MAFVDVRQRITDVGFSRLGEPASYAPPGGGAAVATRAVVRRGMVPVGDFGQASQPTTLITLPTVDVPRPVSGATVTVEGEGEFVLERRQSLDGYKSVIAAREVTP